MKLLIFLFCVLLGLTGIFLFFGLGEFPKTLQMNLLTRWRLSLALSYLLIGGTLGVISLLSQLSFRNLLAEPSFLGIDSVAFLGTMLAIWGGFVRERWIVALMLSGIFSMMLFFLLVLRKWKTTEILFLGIMVNMLAQIGIFTIKYFLNPAQLQHLSLWSLGEIMPLGTFLLIFFSFSIVGLFLGLFFLRTWLFAFFHGFEMSEGFFGRSYLFPQVLLCLIIAFFSSSIVSFYGPIPFVGLLSAWLSQAFFGQGHPYSFLGSFFLGAILLLMSLFLFLHFFSQWDVPLYTIVSGVGAVASLGLFWKKNLSSS